MKLWPVDGWGGMKRRRLGPSCCGPGPAGAGTGRGGAALRGIGAGYRRRISFGVCILRREIESGGE